MPPKIIVGMMGSSPGKGSATLSTPTQVTSFLNVLKSHGVTELDTARAYVGGRSEELLGEVDAQKDFVISTKAPAFSPNSLTYDRILSNSEKSHKALQQEKVDIYYIHGPDEATPLEEQCRAFGKLYKEGRFQRFGVSNLGPSKVQTIYDICKREGYCLPTVFQGSYNALARTPEDKLFPKLKELGIAFYGYGALAGGLLAKPIEDILKPKAGTRFDAMPIYNTIYLNDANIAALKRHREICEAAGISLMEASLRWLRHHTPLGEEDGIILGAATPEQVDAALTACEGGPLPKEVVDGFEYLWNTARETAFKFPE